MILSLRLNPPKSLVEVWIAVNKLLLNHFFALGLLFIIYFFIFFLFVLDTSNMDVIVLDSDSDHEHASYTPTTTCPACFKELFPSKAVRKSFCSCILFRKVIGVIFLWIFCTRRRSECCFFIIIIIIDISPILVVLLIAIFCFLPFFYFRHFWSIKIFVRKGKGQLQR